MRCKRCHKVLKDQTSIERKYGSICFAKRQQELFEQIELNFNPLFAPGISALQKHEIINQVLRLK
jgi:hypothetical protein